MMSASSLPSCERLARAPGRRSFPCAVADRVDSQAAGGIASCSFSTRLPDTVFAFHDREEIGPRMLARIAKRTGLTPDDL